MSKRFFINNLDTRLGEALLKELVKEVPDDPVHMCTMRDQSLPKPKGFKKILKRQKPKLSRKKMLEESDVYIYSIQDTDESDINFVLSIFDKPIEEQKVLILVSDIMAWSASPRKVKPEPKPEPVQGQEGEPKEDEPANNQNKDGDDNDKSQPESPPVKSQGSQPEEKDDEVQEPPKPIQYTFYEDKDYQERVPLPNFEYIKRIEDNILALKKDNVKVFVICPGILYGQGEHLFYELFKAAWLQDPKELPYYGQGTNLIPTIHIGDLAKFIIKVAEAPPEESCPYLLAFDNSKDRSQKCIVESIAKGVGSGSVKPVTASSLFQDMEVMKLNIDIAPSKLLVGTAQEPSGFQWTCQFGLQEGTRKVLEEFCLKHRLRPFNIFAVTPDVERKSKDSKYEDILKDLRKQYRTNILKIEEILIEAKNHAPPELKMDIQEQYMNIVNYLSEKKARALDETLKVLYRVMKWRLSQNDCLCRGYILDSYPRFEQEAKHIFIPLPASKLKRKVKKPEPPKPKKEKEDNTDRDPADGEPEPEPEPEPEAEAEPEPEADGEGEERPKRETFFPESVLKFKRLSDNDERFHNEVADWLAESGVEELIYDATNKQKLEIFQSLRSYIERNGRPDNYLIKQQDLVKEHKQYYTQLNDKLRNEKLSEEERIKNQKKEQMKKREKLAEEVFNELRNEGQAEINNMPFRNYLMEFVVPILNEGLLEVSNIIPNDPVELLAEYLYLKSHDA